MCQYPATQLPQCGVITQLIWCGSRWYRDPNQPIPRTDITRFPHAVLEVKLSLPEGQTAPEWVTDLTESGFLTEVSLDCSTCCGEEVSPLPRVPCASRGARK